MLSPIRCIIETALCPSAPASLVLSETTATLAVLKPGPACAAECKVLTKSPAVMTVARENAT